MIVVMEQQAGASPTARVVECIEAAGFGAHVFHGAERDVIAILQNLQRAGALEADLEVI